MSPRKKKLQDPRHQERGAEEEWNDDDFSIDEEADMDEWDDLSVDDSEESNDLEEWDEDFLIDDKEETDEGE